MAAGGSNEPNLTPFIDLFSVLICFLLMTAAWTQLESVQVQIEEKPKINPVDVADETPPPPPDAKKIKLTLHLQSDRIQIKENEQVRMVSVNGMDVSGGGLRAVLESWKGRLPDDQVIVIESGEKATYGQLIRLYDVVTQSGWSNVAISPY